MIDWLCERLAWLLPRRIVSFGVLRVLHEVMPAQTLDDVLSGHLVHPNSIGWFEALERFDPRGPRPRAKLTVIRENVTPFPGGLHD